MRTRNDIGNDKNIRKAEKIGSFGKWVKRVSAHTTYAYVWMRECVCVHMDDDDDDDLAGIKLCI